MASVGRRFEAGHKAIDVGASAAGAQGVSGGVTGVLSAWLRLKRKRNRAPDWAADVR